MQNFLTLCWTLGSLSHNVTYSSEWMITTFLDFTFRFASPPDEAMSDGDGSCWTFQVARENLYRSLTSQLILARRKGGRGERGEERGIEGGGESTTDTAHEFWSWTQHSATSGKLLLLKGATKVCVWVCDWIYVICEVDEFQQRSCRRTFQIVL